MGNLKHLLSPGAWIIFGIATLLLNFGAHYQPEFVEHWYSRGLFQLIRLGFSGSLGWLPFPAFYLFWIGVIVFWILIYRRVPKLPGFWPKLRFWLFRLAGFAGLVVGSFFWLWGFNYARVPFKTQLHLQLQALDSTTLWRDLETETYLLDSLRTSLVGNDTAALSDERFWPPATEITVRAAVEKWLVQEKFPVHGAVRGRLLLPAGLLFKFGASGIYWPFVGEGNVESGLHPLRKMPAMAHEMSHGYGFCDEGVCNFIAYAACAVHPNAYIAYCARLSYWSMLVRACRRNDPVRYKHEFRPTIPLGILGDDQAIHRQQAKYSELAPSLRYEVYDNYLKAQGIESGMGNYDEMLLLVQAWKRARVAPVL